MTIDPVTGVIDWTVSHATILDFEDLSHNTSAFTGIDKLGSDNVATYAFGDYVLEALESQPAGLGDVRHGEWRILRLDRDWRIGRLAGSPACEISRMRCSIWTPLIWLPPGSVATSPISVTFTGRKLDGTTVTQVHSTTGGSFAPETFPFVGFTDLLEVTWTQQTPFHQFDNIVVSSISRAVTR